MLINVTFKQIFRYFVQMVLIFAMLLFGLCSYWFHNHRNWIWMTEFIFIRKKLIIMNMINVIERNFEKSQQSFAYFGFYWFSFDFLVLLASFVYAQPTFTQFIYFLSESQTLEMVSRSRLQLRRRSQCPTDSPTGLYMQEWSRVLFRMP